MMDYWKPYMTIRIEENLSLGAISIAFVEINMYNYSFFKLWSLLACKLDKTIIHVLDPLKPQVTCS